MTARCSACSLPVALRAEVARRGRQGESLRKISDHVTNAGHPIGRDGIANHLRKCVGVSEVHDGSDPATRAAMVANSVALGMRGWWGKLEVIAQDLAASGLTTEALILQAEIPDSMRKALSEAEGSPVHELLAARCLAEACRRVLSVSHPEAARAIAADLAKQGAEELASDLLWLADRASTHLASATTDRQPEGSAAGSAPPAASDNEESA